MDPSGLSFAKSLFLGRLASESIHPFPVQSESDRETASMVLDSFREFAEQEIDGERFDREHEVPESVRRGLAELGLLGLTVPEEQGGAGLPFATYCRVMEETNRYCGSTAVILGGHQSIGIKALLLHGSETQCSEWLPKLAAGEWFAAYALSEPQAGSDPRRARDDGRSHRRRASPRAAGPEDLVHERRLRRLHHRVRKDTGRRRRASHHVLRGHAGGDGEGFTRGAEEDKLGLRGSSDDSVVLRRLQGAEREHPR